MTTLTKGPFKLGLFPTRVNGDILHNGLGYPREHLRIHAYLYPPGYDHPSEVHFERASPTAPGAL